MPLKKPLKSIRINSQWTNDDARASSILVNNMDVDLTMDVVALTTAIRLGAPSLPLRVYRGCHVSLLFVKSNNYNREMLLLMTSTRRCRRCGTNWALWELMFVADVTVV